LAGLLSLHLASLLWPSFGALGYPRLAGIL
jgi:hypothetical protein